MINKHIQFLLIICFGLSIMKTSIGQTIVSTEVENRNAILEEFTGRTCMYCPNGHALAAQLEEAYPEDIFVIARHAGSFSPTDYPNLNLPESDSIRTFYSITGYPSGTINRELYQGAGPKLGLSEWQGATNAILGQTSYVNVGVEAEINPADRTLSVHTELYYTGDATSGNKISVVLVQNGIIGFQIGIGDYYEFNHCPIYHLTGIWGEQIATTSSGTFIDKTYTLELPEFFNDVAINLNNLAVVVYVSEDDETIVSGSGADVEISAVYDNDPSMTDASIPSGICKNKLTPVIEVQNTGNNAISSIDFQYKVNNSDFQNHTWNGNLEFLEKATITLPEISFNIQQNNLFEASILNDDNNTNNIIQKPFDFAYDVKGEFLIEYKTIFEAEENYWEIVNCDGQVVLSGSDYSNLSFYEIPVSIEDDGCFEFVLYDTEGNGFASPSAYLRIKKGEEVIFEANNDFGDAAIWPFASNYNIGMAKPSPTNELERVAIPNPVVHSFTIPDLKDANISLYNAKGTLVKTIEHYNSEEQIDISELASGIYWAQVLIESKTISLKIMKL